MSQSIAISPTKEQSEQRERITRTIAYYVVFVALGMSGVTLGPTLQGLASHTHTILSEISFLFTARSLGYMTGSFLAGRLYDRIPGHPLVGMMLITMVVALLLIPAIPLLWLLLVVLLVLGLAEGAVDVGGNTLLVWVHGRDVSPFMNGLHFFWGLGAFLSPVIIAQAVLISGDINWGYWAIAALVLPAALWLLRLPSPTSHRGAAEHPARQVNLRLLALIVAFFIIYIGAEATFGGWIYTYAVAMGQSDKTTAAYLTSAFWGAITFGRLLSIPIGARLEPDKVLLGDMIGCVVSIAIILVLPRSNVAIWIGTFGTGLFMASMFPTMISFAERHILITGQITGWFLVGSALGGMTLPWLVGQLFDVIGPRVTMMIIFTDTLCGFVVFLALLATASRPVLRPVAEPEIEPDVSIDLG